VSNSIIFLHGKTKFAKDAACATALAMDKI